jgi:hypothetical protein
MMYAQLGNARRLYGVRPSEHSHVPAFAGLGNVGVNKRYQANLLFIGFHHSGDRKIRST